MTVYLQGILNARYFWFHLALSDLRARWRRSFFGIFWSMLQPLGLTILIFFVFSHLFKVSATTYIPYIFSGVIVWDFLVSSIMGGATSFMQAESYIKQYKHPLAIYTLRTVLSSLIIFIMASIPCMLWALTVMPKNFGFCWLALPLALPVFILIAWPLATCMAYIGVRFRDLPPALAIILQALWFISPVYFEEKMFRSGGLNWLVDYNPVYHLLQLMRAPLLYGEWPTAENYMYSLITILSLLGIVVLLGHKSERKVVFYL